MNSHPTKPGAPADYFDLLVVLVVELADAFLLACFLWCFLVFVVELVLLGVLL